MKNLNLHCRREIGGLNDICHRMHKNARIMVAEACRAVYCGSLSLWSIAAKLLFKN